MKKPTSPSARYPKAAKVRYAVVGLGHIAQAAVLPGMAHARKNSSIAALVSDDPEKLAAMAKAYKVASTWDYGGFDDCLRSEQVDAVYIALPNDLHHEYALRACRAGKHVLCEKPMALDERQCEEMIRAADEAGVKLMIAYRLHFERANLTAIATAARKLGELRFFNSIFSMQVTPNDIRTRPIAQGGGTLYDLGIYCINAARYLFQAEPVEVFARSARGGDPRFAAIDEMTAVTMRFPGERLATFISSFGASSTASYDLVGSEGSMHVDSAYEYEEEIELTVCIDGKDKTTTFPVHDHFAAEIDYFSECILENADVEPSGAEGLADIRIIRALHESAASGRPVAIQGIPKIPRPGPEQEVSYPPPKKKPEPVHVQPSSRDS